MKTLNKKRCVIATIKSWNIEEAKRFVLKNSGIKILLITNKNELTYQKIKNFNPRYLFFPHWSWVIPEKIFKNYECVGFHMTDLPFGRGGSPLQNLIVRGIYKTKIAALKVIKKMDAGPVYLKRNLSLIGSAKQIYMKASRIIFRQMIPYIIKNEPEPISQRGRVFMFKRRSPGESKIPDDIDLNGAYDYIRMLDGEGYPSAFIENQNLRLEFTKAAKGNNYIEAKVRITKKEKK